MYHKTGILMNSPSKPYVCNPSGITLELDYIADTIFHSAPTPTVDGKSSSMFTFRIYGGGSSNIQTMQLIFAIRELNIDQRLYSIETLTCNDVNVNHYLIQDSVKWLQASTEHFITGHVHQGLQLEILDSETSTRTGHRFTTNSILKELHAATH